MNNSSDWISLNLLLPRVQDEFGLSGSRIKAFLVGELYRGYNGSGISGISALVTEANGSFPATAEFPVLLSMDLKHRFALVQDLGGWSAVDWDSGAIQGHAVKVFWPDVIRIIMSAMPSLAAISDSRATSNQPNTPPERRGLPRIDYRQWDAPLIVEMEAMIADGRARNPTDAARALVVKGSVKGAGNDGSKVTRLVRHYYNRT